MKHVRFIKKIIKEKKKKKKKKITKYKGCYFGFLILTHLSSEALKASVERKFGDFCI